MSASPTSPPPPPSSTAIPTSSSPTTLPLRSIPGSYGWPILGAISDRLDYSWFQGPATFFRSRIEKNKSTVFRTNVPPSFPLFTGVDPRVIAVLDCKSSSYLFDMDLVEKKNVLVGDFMPSVDYTGGIRPCAYLDTAEPDHTKVKGYAIDILKRSSKTWVTELVSSMDSLCSTIDTEIAKSGKASYIFPLQRSLFEFLSKAIIGADPKAQPEIAESGYSMIDRWLALQLMPIVPITAFQPLPEILLHSFRYPFWLVSGDYKKLTEFIDKHGNEAIELGMNEFGLSRNECINNLLFILGFNAFGGFSVFLPGLISTVVSDKTGLQEKLRAEVREKIGSSSLNFESVSRLELIPSVIYETLRMNPPVPNAYARARKDFLLKSHDSEFEVKKGELLCCYYQVAMEDPKIFDEPDKFKPDRFVGEKGKELLNYLYWSNGRQTSKPSVSNKQCAAADLVTLSGSLILAYLFQRYDDITGDSGSITALKKATNN
ncbi:hypothetical protein ACFE04_017863 [Oxalis oulophora]